MEKKFSYILEKCEEKSLYGTKDKTLVYVISNISQETIMEVSYCREVGIRPVLDKKLAPFLESQLKLTFV